MNNEETLFEATKKALYNFEKIKQGLQGIFEILKMTYSDKNIYYLLAQDNIRAIYGSFLEILTNQIGTIELMEKVNRAELDLDIPLDNLL